MGLLLTAVIGWLLVASSHVLLSALPLRLQEREVATIPSYVLDYAPKVWLHSGELYLPSDIGAQLQHTAPESNFVPITANPPQLTLDNLDSLNGLVASSQQVYLTSKDDVTKNPSWLNGVVPDPATGKTNGAVSCVIIVNDHGSGQVDAFYMYFYAYNQGNTVLSFEIGDHVGDWEHNMIRFQNGQPQTIWYSQHGNGEAFTYEAVEKQGQRPVTYSGKGSHANYATPGTHDHAIPDFNLPFGLVADYCDQGKLWDPTWSAYIYSYRASDQSFTPATAGNPVGFLKYRGTWGDQQYPDSDPRQRKIFGISATAKYVTGPTGPQDKQLDRRDVCPDNGIPCIIRDILGP